MVAVRRRHGRRVRRGDPVAAEGFLAGKAALVTGGSRNLGATIAERLAAHGASVAITYRADAEAAGAVVAGLRARTGREHMALRADLAEAEAPEAVVAEALAALGRLDVLVNNAGPFTLLSLAELPVAEWDAVVHANVRAAFLATRAAAPALRAAGSGRVVNLAAASTAFRNHSVYGLAKEAVVFLTEELAYELGPEIAVNAVSPGQIEESAEDVAVFDPTFVERAIQATPLRRLVTRAEVAEVVCQLCGPAFACVTGATIPVDGGFRLRGF